MEGDFNQAFFAALDPFGPGQRREHGGGEAFAIGLVTGDAMAFAAVNFVAFFEEGKGFSFEGSGGGWHFFGGVAFDFLSFEVGGGGFEDGLEPRVDGLTRHSFEDWQSFLRREPGGGDRCF